MAVEMASSTTATSSLILDRIHPILSRCLNIGNVLPYLKQAQLLTDDEEQQLELSPHNTSQDAARKLVRFLKSKGSGLRTAELFLSALKQAREADVHLGHDEIIEELERLLDRHSTTHSSNEIDNMQTSEDSLPHLPHLASKEPTQLARVEYVTGLEGPQKEKLRCKLVKNSRNILVAFSSLVLDVFRLLRRLDVPFEEVQIFLMFLRCSQTLPDARMFDERNSDISQAQDLQQLILSLRNYTSWFNYHLIKVIASKFGQEEGARLINDYEEQLKNYFIDQLVYQCPEFSLTDKVPRGYEELTVKLAKDYTSFSTQDLTLLRLTMSELLSIEPHVFNLRSIEEGCVLVTWAVPSSVGQHIVSTALQCMEDLSHHEVIWIRIFGKVIEVNFSSENKDEASSVCCAVDVESTTEEDVVSSLDKSLSIERSSSNRSSSSNGSFLAGTANNPEAESLSAQHSCASAVDSPSQLTHLQRAISLPAKLSSRAVNTLPALPENSAHASECGSAIHIRQCSSDTDPQADRERERTPSSLDECSTPESRGAKSSMLKKGKGIIKSLKLFKKGLSRSEPELTASHKTEEMAHLKILELAGEPVSRSRICYYCVHGEEFIENDTSSLNKSSPITISSLHQRITELPKIIETEENSPSILPRTFKTETTNSNASPHLNLNLLQLPPSTSPQTGSPVSSLGYLSGSSQDTVYEEQPSEIEQMRMDSTLVLLPERSRSFNKSIAKVSPKRSRSVSVSYKAHPASSPVSPSVSGYMSETSLSAMSDNSQDNLSAVRSRSNTFSSSDHSPVSETANPYSPLSIHTNK